MCFLGTFDFNGFGQVSFVPSLFPAAKIPHILWIQFMVLRSHRHVKLFGMSMNMVTCIYDYMGYVQKLNSYFQNYILQGQLEMSLSSQQ